MKKSRKPIFLLCLLVLLAAGAFALYRTGALERLGLQGITPESPAADNSENTPASGISALFTSAGNSGESGKTGTNGKEHLFDDLTGVPDSDGRMLVCDGDHFYFSWRSDDDEYSRSQKDGVYRADLSFGSVTFLAKGNFSPLLLDGDRLIFGGEGSLDSGIASVNKAATEMVWLKVEDTPRAVDSLGFWGDGLYYVRYDDLSLARANEDGTLDTEIQDTKNGYVMEAQAGDDGLYFLNYDPEDGSHTLRLFRSKGEEPVIVAEEDTYSFTISGGRVYYAAVVPDQPEYEDYRQLEFTLVRSDSDGNAEQTGISGRFSGGLIPSGPYIFYSKYSETSQNSSDDEVLTVRRPYCYDTVSGTETEISCEGFEGWDVRLRDVSGGWMYCDLYYAGGYSDGELSHSVVFNLADPDKFISLNDLVEESEISVAVTNRDELDEIEYAKRKEEEAIQAEERRRQREEEARNEPYGPGTSKLILKAGSRSACYRLVRMDGSTEFQILLSPNEKITQSFPSGRYVLKIAEGETWISDEEAFGPDGNYDTTNIFRFEEGETYYITVGTQGSFYHDSQQGFTN